VIAVVVVAAALAVVAVVLALSLLRSRTAASSAGRAADDTRGQLDVAQTALAARVAEVEELRRSADELRASHDQLLEEAASAAADDHAADVGTRALAALWALTRIRQEWTSRRSAVLSLDQEPPEGRWATATLAQVLDEEVSRIREDTGTPGTLRTSLPDEPDAAQSVLLITSVQALLETLTRHCQGYDLYVHEWERRLTAIVVCEGFDGPDQVASDATSVLTAIDRDSKGRLRARLSLAVEP
jgi:hypothetical protein